MFDDAVVDVVKVVVEAKETVVGIVVLVVDVVGVWVFVDETCVVSAPKVETFWVTFVDAEVTWDEAVDKVLELVMPVESVWTELIEPVLVEAEGLELDDVISLWVALDKVDSVWIEEMLCSDVTRFVWVDEPIFVDCVWILLVCCVAGEVELCEDPVEFVTDEKLDCVESDWIVPPETVEIVTTVVESNLLVSVEIIVDVIWDPVALETVVSVWVDPVLVMLACPVDCEITVENVLEWDESMLVCDESVILDWVWAVDELSVVFAKVRVCWVDDPVCKDIWSDDRVASFVVVSE